MITTAFIFSATCCMCAFALDRTMQSERDIFWFVPAYIERAFGVESVLYKVVTCPVCLTGQIAAWSGLFVFYGHGNLPRSFMFHIIATLVAIFLARVCEKWFNA